MLARKKQNKRTTKPIPFKFAKKKKKTTYESKECNYCDHPYMNTKNSTQGKWYGKKSDPIERAKAAVKENLNPRTVKYMTEAKEKYDQKLHRDRMKK